MTYFHRSNMSNKKLNSDKIRLNRFIAMCGVSSRRKADNLIEEGHISINGEIVTSLGHKVQMSKDIIRLKGDVILPEKKQYILLNKPRGYITTTNDDRGRKEVMLLVKNACKERIFPVGRLDKETTGLLLFTNDGLLAKKLMHPKHIIPKIYHVTLNKPLTNKELSQIKSGINLEDGLVNVDNVSFLNNNKAKLEIQIHIGKNRIVRRIFKFLNYNVIELDRVSYSFLNKEGLKVGKWRKLQFKEVAMLRKQ